MNVDATADIALVGAATVSAVTVEVRVLPPPTSIFTVAGTGPFPTERMVPFNGLRALSAHDPFPCERHGAA